jgi:hypothetical protein
MRCVECGRLKTSPAERGWVTVLTPSGARRIHYCCGCMEQLVQRASAAEQVDDYPDDESTA